ncbi:MAG: glycosyltransferase family 9 protein, partial [Bryobacteraceae bacterium]
ILVHAEQGLGDTIHFARLIGQVAARGGRVVFEVQPELLRLMRGLEGVAELVERGAELPRFDCHSPLLSLPRSLGLRVNTIPAQAPYLAAEPALAERWRTLRRAGCRHIGLVWAGNASHANDANRSIALAKLAPLAGIQNVEWFSLQKGSAARQAPPAGLNLRDLAPELHDFAGTAAAIVNFDLVITVDTAVAHLAGALGVPVWVLLPHSPDWRWLLDRDDSPWYPMRLFRQSAPGDWDGVFARVVENLAPATAEAARGPDPSRLRHRAVVRSVADRGPVGSARVDRRRLHPRRLGRARSRLRRHGA